jgi:ribosomal protein S18 acetylase RimI-like enzyme
MALENLKIWEATATPDAAMSIASVLQEAYANDENGVQPRSTALDEKSWDICCALGEKRYEALLVFANSQTAATVRWQFEGDALYFSRLAVRPAFQRQGIATLLLERLEEIAREAGATRLTCMVRIEIEKNLNMYLRRGFVLVDEHSVCRDGTPVRTGHLEKKLA